MKKLAIALLILTTNFLNAEHLCLPKIETSKYIRYENDALCFYFDYDRAYEEYIHDVKVLTGITVSGIAATLAGIYGLTKTDSLPGMGLSLAATALGAAGALGGGSVAALRVCCRPSPGDKPFRILDSEGLWDKNFGKLGKIKWVNIDKIVIHQTIGCPLGAMAITSLNKNDGVRLIYGELPDLLQLNDLLCQYIHKK